MSSNEKNQKNAEMKYIIFEISKGQEALSSFKTTNKNDKEKKNENK